MQINGQPINPGELRTLITLQTAVIEQDESGAQRAVWADLAQVWSRWIHAHGQETLLSQALQSQALATVRIRYRVDVDETCAVVKDGLRWEIIAPPEDIQERHEYLDLSVRLVKGSS